jgi:phosphoribosylaminoimidazole (AIR) synthetase
VLIGVASNGPHTNGYSLLRKVFEWLPMDATPPGFDCSLGDALLVPHRSYLEVLDAVVASPMLKAMAHITGGGLPENVPRVLPDDCDAIIHRDAWPVPALFALVAEATPRLDAYELHRTLNMGIGMVLVCSPRHVPQLQERIAEPTWVVGEVVPARGGPRRVELR